MPLDSGLSAFVSLLGFLGKPADAAQLRHEFSPEGDDPSDHILYAAERLEVKPRRERASPQRSDKADPIASITDATLKCDTIARTPVRRRIMFGKCAPFGTWRRLSPRQICDHDTGGKPQR